MDGLIKLNSCYTRSDLPVINVGDKIEITLKCINLEKKDFFKITRFKGTVIGKRNANNKNYTFKVLKESEKIAITSVFCYHSPLIVGIKKLGKVNFKINRAKLNYVERALYNKKDNE